MKNQLKTLFVVAICFFTATAVDAQMQLGIGAGVNASSYIKSHPYARFRNGLQFGIYGQMPLNQKGNLYFQPEINYSNQGERAVALDFKNGRMKRQDVYVNHINVPLSIKYYLVNTDEDIFLIAGPYVGFKISEKVTKVNFPNQVNDIEKRNGFDAGFTIGLGATFKKQFEFTGRYYYGLVDELKDDLRNNKNRTSIINFGITYFFSKK